MIDTVKLRACHALPPYQKLRANGFRFSVSRHQVVTWHHNETLSNGSSLKVHWTETPTGQGYLYAEASLASVLNGGNVWPIKSDQEIDQAMRIIGATTSQVADVCFDPWNANVSRVDFCYQWNVGEQEVYSRLRALRDWQIPHMTPHPVASTLYFGNKSQEYTLYAKYADTLVRLKEGEATEEQVSAALGVLRMERRFLKTWLCRKLAKSLELSDHRAAHLLKSNVAERVLNETITAMGIDQPLKSLTSRDALLKHYGVSPRFCRLDGFLSLCNQFGADNLVKLGFGAQNFRNYRHELKEAGAWPPSSTTQNLAPLRLVWSKPEIQMLVA